MPPYGQLREATALLADPARLLRARAAEDGYLFLRGLLEPGPLAALRARIVDILLRRGLIDASPGAGAEVALPERVAAQPPDPAVGSVDLACYAEIQALEELHALSHQPALMELFTALFDETPLPHARIIARIMLPSAATFPTPPHQDFPLVQGSEDTWTCWIPLADTPVSRGPLALRAGSHRQGVRPTARADGAGGTAVAAAEADADWLTADYRAGDVVTFHSLTVHRGLPNRDAPAIRLSVDTRFQPASAPIQAASLQPHLAWSRPMPGWEALYAGWRGLAPRYYWRERRLTFVPGEPRLYAGLADADPAVLATLTERMNDRSGL